MAVTVQARGSPERVSSEQPETLGDSLALPKPAEERQRRAEVLVALAGGRRAPLKELHAKYLHRLHRASDDFDATEGLRVVERALWLVPRVETPPGTAPDRTGRRRWWGRLRDLR